MKNFFRAIIIISGFIVFNNVFFIKTCIAQNDSSFEAYYLHINDYPPFDATPSWGEGESEAEGIAHDNTNWYITSTTKDQFLGQFGALWKIPVEENLNQDFTNNPRVKVFYSYKFPQIKDYIHWGDLDHYLSPYDNIDYLLVPVTTASKNLPNPAILIFRCSDLSLVGYDTLAGPTIHKQKDVGWCAIDHRSGDLYTSNDSPDDSISSPPFLFTGTTLFHYSIKWNILKKTGYMGLIKDFVQYYETDTLKIKRNFGGQTYLELFPLQNMQGGEFSESGNLIYISNGGGKCKTVGDGEDIFDGIHVFDTKTWVEVQSSTNHDRDQVGNFDYHYDGGCGIFEANAHTPEGLTIWDLDGVRAPNIQGQLHVLVSDVGFWDNRSCIEHFTNKLLADESRGSPANWRNFPNQLSGTSAQPFFTMKDAFTWYPAWNGAQIILKKGSYLDIGKYSTRVKISSEGGPATIGSNSTNIKGVVLYENPNYKGDYRYFNTDIPDLDNDTINFEKVTSSIKVYNVKEIILYDDTYYKGSSFIVTKDIYDLTPIDWNDRIRSLKIIKY